jgi:hypothetical protein
MNLPNCAAAYPFVDGNGFWCTRAGVVVDHCEPECRHRVPRLPFPEPARFA